MVTTKGRRIRDAAAVPSPDPVDRSSTQWTEPTAAIVERRLRVLFCIDNMGIGGTELNAVRTAERLDRSRFDLFLLCLQDRGPLLARYEAQGIPALRLPIRHLYGPTALRQGWRLMRFLKRARIDIVHCHDVYDNIFTTFWSRLARVPVVIASRRWWDEVPRRALRAVNRRAYRFADCVIANSATIADLLVEREGVPAERVTVIPNFVDERAFAAPRSGARQAFYAELGVPVDAIVVGCIAGLRPVKDHASLLHAVASLVSRWPSLHIVLVGDGDARPSLALLAAQLGIADRVHFAGTRPNDPNLHHLFDISVLCSLSEAFPNSIVEAMAAARPVVATRVGGVADAVVDGTTGRLVEPRNPAALASALEQLLADTEMRQAMGRAGQRRARVQFHADGVIPALESLYERLFAARTR